MADLPGTGGLPPIRRSRFIFLAVLTLFISILLNSALMYLTLGDNFIEMIYDEMIAGLTDEEIREIEYDSDIFLLLVIVISNMMVLFPLSVLLMIAAVKFKNTSLFFHIATGTISGVIIMFLFSNGELLDFYANNIDIALKHLGYYPFQFSCVWLLQFILFRPLWTQPHSRPDDFVNTF